MDFKGCERQFDWIEILPVYDKSGKHTTIYDSYNAACMAKMMQNIKLSNISDADNATNPMKFDINNNTQKHLLWKQYIAWHSDSYTNAPISDYINNPVLQELLPENTYMSKSSYERIYIDLRDSLWYTNEVEKLSRNDPKLKLTIETKTPLTKKKKKKKWGFRFGVIEMGNIFICCWTVA